MELAVRFCIEVNPPIIMINDEVEAVYKEIYPDMYGQAFFESLDMTRC